MTVKHEDETRLEYLERRRRGLRDELTTGVMGQPRALADYETVLMSLASEVASVAAKQTVDRAEARAAAAERQAKLAVAEAMSMRARIVQQDEQLEKLAWALHNQIETHGLNAKHALDKANARIIAQRDRALAFGEAVKRLGAETRAAFDTIREARADVRWTFAMKTNPRALAAPSAMKHRAARKGCLQIGAAVARIDEALRTVEREVETGLK